MTNCACGREVRLRAIRVTAYRRRGVGHWIEHTDGSPVCPPGDWRCVAMKPYAKNESEREYARLQRRWEAALSGERKE
jgi:hypothetical protein